MLVRIAIVLFLGSLEIAAQEVRPTTPYTLDVSPFYGSVVLHNTDIAHLISDHPSGFILGYNRKTYGEEYWQQAYNYPDLGFSMVYQNLHNPTLGHNIGLYAHYNFYFFNRNIQFRIGQGLAYNTNPYDKFENFRNNAYGTHLLSSTYLMFNYQRENLYGPLGLKAGISLVHYSNANFRAPNTSTNTFAFNAGLVYSLEKAYEREYIRVEKPVFEAEPLHFNLVFRSGLNESDVVDSGQYPFYIISAYLDKQIGRKSAVQLGTDLFFSNFLKELIRFRAISFPEMNPDPEADYKRIGMHMGHELSIGKTGLLTQLGYYIYYPFDFEGRVYNRIGLKRYFGDRWFAALTLKSHAAKAEAVEFGLGIRL